jgi:hypothetical protein
VAQSGASTGDRSPLLIVSWVLVAIVIGGAAAAARWANEAGVFARFIPKGSGSSLLPPPT